MRFEDILNSQRSFFLQQKTRPISFRKMQLELFLKCIERNKEALNTAVEEDFGKSSFDTYSTEISMLISEIKFFIRNLEKLSRPQRVGTNLANLPGSSKIIPEPLGNTLIIGAWNYPIQLSLLPCVAAIAAGNTVILKPSEIAPSTMKAIKNIISSTFRSELFAVVEAGPKETEELLKHKFDKIFFTGSTKIGKLVYEAAAKNLTPVTLELGGKSPVIVTKHANFPVAAKRIVWGKFLNAGQTCIAPDYLYIEESVKDKFLEYLREYIVKFNYSSESPHYTKIINERNFNRLKALVDPNKIYFGGEFDIEKRFISPTLLHHVSWSDEIMQEEIFGPLMPVLTFNNLRQVITDINQKATPLAAYLFSDNKEEKKQFLENLSFGGGCINDVLMHVSNPKLPFGGKGNSGIGNYHGKQSFLAFSHYKSILNKCTWGEPDIKYPPYSEKKLGWIKRLLD